MKRLKVLTVVGTRPEIIRLSRVLARLDEHCHHVLVHTGQNYDFELNQVFFDDLEVRKPDHFLNSAEGSTGAAHTIGNLIIAVDKVLDEVKPEAMLVLGDTNSCLSVIPAKRRKIPIFHMEAGNRCFDQRVPEETNRRIVDHTADINLTYSAIARDYLLREGLPPDRVITTGSPMYEVLHHYLPTIQASDVLSRLGLTPRDYYVVSVHREENVDDEAHFDAIIAILRQLSGSGQPIVVSTHPRTRKWLDERHVQVPPGVSFLKPLGFLDYVRLELDAQCTLSDSGTITEESNILGFPALNLRETHERPEGMEEAAVIMTGLRPERVVESLAVAEAQPRGPDHTLRLVRDYAVPNVSEKVLRIILSYTDYVRRVVWGQA